MCFEIYLNIYANWNMLPVSLQLVMRMLLYWQIWSKLPLRCGQKSMYVGRYILRVHYLCHALIKTGTSQKILVELLQYEILGKTVLLGFVLLWGTILQHLFAGIQKLSHVKIAKFSDLRLAAHFDIDLCLMEGSMFACKELEGNILLLLLLLKCSLRTVVTKLLDTWT